LTEIRGEVNLPPNSREFPLRWWKWSIAGNSWE